VDLAAEDGDAPEVETIRTPRGRIALVDGTEVDVRESALLLALQPSCSTIGFSKMIVWIIPLAI
jgi:hypothetical protein